MKEGNLDAFSSRYLDGIAERLYSSVLSDVLDAAGHRHQVMRPEVRPLYAGAKVVGRAATMLAIEVSELPPDPYELLMDLLDGLRPGEVVVGAVQGESRAALWGELLSTHTRAKGGRGVVIEGDGAS
jgi:4-hydroxy-4-methyl-2-oxoglutarate aldolase